MSTPFDVPFEITLTPRIDGLRVMSFRGHEEISGLYRVDVRIATSTPEGDFEASVLEQPARLLMRTTGGTPRALHGIVAAVEAQGTLLQDRPVYELRLVPRLWLLKRRRTRRIFQDKSVVDIVDTLLTEWRIPTQWRVTRDYPKRAYCVQHRETDYAFLIRLLAEEGIFFYFDHPTGLDDEESSTGVGAAEIVVLSDAAEHYPPLDGGETLVLRRAQADHDGGALLSREDQVFSFVLRNRVRSRATLVRGYDPQRPRLDLRAMACISERSAAPAAATPMLYEHQGNCEHPGSYEGRPANPEIAAIRLEQERARVTVGQGMTWSRRLVPGRRFTLRDHDSDALDQAYVVTRVEHEGYSPEAAPEGRPLYQGRFECAPATVRFRPPRPRRPIHALTETAVVVGPGTREIHTDEQGRVKVQFHWDLEGRMDEHSSCWIRVAQAWAGAGWGTQFIPRVGMEVVVTFLGGDIDRPMVTGCVYNATHPPPYPLPGSAATSGIRTQSSPGGDGWNELSFNDEAHRERIYLHAQKDFDEVVENDHTRAVEGEEKVHVGKGRTTEILADNVRVVRGSEVVTVHEHLILHVVGRQIIQIDGLSPGDSMSQSSAPTEPPGPPEPIDMVRHPVEVVSSAAPIPKVRLALQEIEEARLLWQICRLPDGEYERAQELFDRIRGERLTFDRVGRAMDAEQSMLGLRGRLAQILRGVIDPESAALGPVRVAVIEHVIQLDRRVEAAQRASGSQPRSDRNAALPASDPLDDAGCIRGGGRGGGGAKVSDWSNQDHRDKTSILTIAGGGIIDSPNGLTLVGDGGSIRMEGGTMTLRATKIVLQAEAIEIESSGETTVAGHPIRLNK